MIMIEHMITNTYNKREIDKFPLQLSLIFMPEKGSMLLIGSSTHSIRGRTYSTLTEEHTFVGGVCASHYSFVRPAISCFLMVCVFVTYV